MSKWDDKEDGINIWPSFADVAICSMIIFVVYTFFLLIQPEKIQVGELSSGVANFSSGSALLPPNAKMVIDQYKKEILEGKYKEVWGDSTWVIIVAGHTDSDPLRVGNPYINNWGLSSARAHSVVNYLLESSEGEIPPSRIRAIGYGEYRPSTDSVGVGDDFKANNRRIEIFLMKSDGNI